VGRARPGLAAGLAAALVLGALALGGVFGPGAAAPPPPALALGAPDGPAITIGPHPIGLSIEYPLLEHDLGGGPCPPRALVEAIEALGSPTLRIGGDSQDEIAPAGTAAHSGLTALPADFWTQIGCLERETGIPVVVGLNLAWGRPAWAAELAAGARAVIPRSRLSFELGNEPDTYGVPVPWWNGRALVEGRMPWRIYLLRARALEAVLGPGTSVEGPDFASGRWTARVPALARTLHLQSIDAHYYPLEGCAGRDDASIAALLSRQIQTKLEERLGFARDARAAGVPAVISESNSVSCGGVPGVSDQPAAAVWAVRMIVTALRDGFASVRFHSSGGPYDPFVVRGASVTARPLYAGLRAAAGLLVPGGVLRAISGARALDGVAITDPDGTRTVLLSNYGSRARWVLLRTAARALLLSVRARSPVVASVSVAPDGARLRAKLPPDSFDAITIEAQAGSSR
jgi:hypothetical protein